MSGCICHWIQPTTSATEVLILQHPLEVKQSKGSANLLGLSLLNSRIVVGESFAPTQLHELLNASWTANPSSITPEPVPKHAVLLYPEGSQRNAYAGQSASNLCAGPAQLRLVVIDATWRKSRKMLHLNPLLERLPRLRLDAVPRSKYLIRKAHRPDQLSSFEATCLALNQLEGPDLKFERLLVAFDGFVSQQIQAKCAAMAKLNLSHIESHT